MSSKEKIGIVYSAMFDDFLESLHDDERAELIKNEIEKFADGFVDLDPRDCKHFADREKVGVPDANVVVYYDIKKNDWTFIGGLEVKLRAA